MTRILFSLVRRLRLIINFRNISVTMDKKRSEIQSYYKDKTIFITGASGFMGKVLLEKLLYCCSEIDKIYILIRDKKGHSSDTRLNDIFDSPVRHSANPITLFSLILYITILWYPECLQILQNIHMFLSV